MRAVKTYQKARGLQEKYSGLQIVYLQPLISVVSQFYYIGVIKSSSCTRPTSNVFFFSVPDVESRDPEVLLPTAL